MAGIHEMTLPLTYVDSVEVTRRRCQHKLSKKGLKHLLKSCTLKRVDSFDLEGTHCPHVRFDLSDDEATTLALKHVDSFELEGTGCPRKDSDLKDDEDSTLLALKHVDSFELEGTGCPRKDSDITCSFGEVATHSACRLATIFKSVLRGHTTRICCTQRPQISAPVRGAKVHAGFYAGEIHDIQHFRESWRDDLCDAYHMRR